MNRLSLPRTNFKISFLNVHACPRLAIAPKIHAFHLMIRKVPLRGDR
jgi:hypothetical protein